MGNIAPLRGWGSNTRRRKHSPLYFMAWPSYCAVALALWARQHMVRAALRRVVGVRWHWTGELYRRIEDRVFLSETHLKASPECQLTLCGCIALPCLTAGVGEVEHIEGSAARRGVLCKHCREAYERAIKFGSLPTGLDYSTVPTLEHIRYDGLNHRRDPMRYKKRYVAVNQTREEGYGT